MTFEEWRHRARPLLAAAVEPDIACRTIAEGANPEGANPEGANPRAALPAPARRLLPAALMRLLESISCFRADGRYDLMYRLAWRTLFENPKLIEDAADADVRNATLMDAAVRRDVHKMHAFVRFRESGADEDESTYFAWFEPEHEILRRGSVFFVKRFPNMKWIIATPEGAAVWDKAVLNFTASPEPGARPGGDGYEHLWRTYYRSICNAARINPRAMQREMPQKYWKNLPEAADIRNLIRDASDTSAGRHEQARDRADRMTEAVKRALADVPPPAGGPQECRRCELWQHATQAVAGSGPKDALVMLVGEQPGDEEDLRGRPFVGPAGRVLDQAIADAGLARSQLYITNSVKHFKWEPRGKRRLHKRPDAGEVSACNLWLDREIADIKPQVIVALGATALHALVGSRSSVDAARRETLAHASGAAIVATYHPSAILRSEGDRAATLGESLVADLARAGKLSGIATQ